MTWVLILLIAMPDGGAQRVEIGSPHLTLAACEVARSATLARLGLPDTRATCEERT